MSFLNNLYWRFATKEFDTKKPVKKQDLKKILEAIRLAPTSRGLQPFHVFVISDLSLRKKIKEHSADQDQVDTCSHLLVFCTRTDSKRADDYINYVSGGDIAKKEKLTTFHQSLKSAFLKRSPEQLLAWAQRQTYIAFGFGLAACAELKIDSCPMEGFENNAIDKILKLPPHLKSLGYLAIGYRAKEPTREKFRFPEDDLFTFI